MRSMSKFPARNVFPIPGTLTFEQAAAFPLVSVTAWHMLFTLADLRLGEDVLIMGAGSGVGAHGDPNGQARRRQGHHHGRQR